MTVRWGPERKQRQWESPGEVWADQRVNKHRAVHSTDARCHQQCQVFVPSRLEIMRSLTPPRPGGHLAGYGGLAPAERRDVAAKAAWCTALMGRAAGGGGRSSATSHAGMDPRATERLQPPETLARLSSGSVAPAGIEKMTLEPSYTASVFCRCL